MREAHEMVKIAMGDLEMVRDIIIDLEGLIAHAYLVVGAENGRECYCDNNLEIPIYEREICVYHRLILIGECYFGRGEEIEEVSYDG